MSRPMLVRASERALLNFASAIERTIAYWVLE